MKLKYLISFILSILVVIAVTTSGGIVAWKAGVIGEEALRAATQDRLKVARDLQKNAIEGYFRTVKGQLRTFAANAATMAAMEGFSTVAKSQKYEPLSADEIGRLRAYYTDEFGGKYQTINLGQQINADKLLEALPNHTKAMQLNYIADNKHPLGEKEQLESLYDGSDYDNLHRQLHPSIRGYLEEFGFYDIFLIDPESGEIIYSVFKELDFATSLKDGPYANTGIGQAYRKALDVNEPGQVVMTDFSPYLPSYDNPAAFIATPIFNYGEKMGVVIFQIPIDPINNIMTNNHNWEDAGLGETGESFLVGRDSTMRSVSRILENQPEYFKQRLLERGVDAKRLNTMLEKQTSIGLLDVSSKATQALFTGESGVTDTISYYGDPAFSAYTPLNIEGVQWGIVSEISESEAIADAVTLRQTILRISIITIVCLGIAAVVLGRVLAGRLLAPLIEASKAAATIAQGKLSDQANFSNAKNEIGDLSRALSQMRGNLQTTVSQISNGAQDLDVSAREFALQSEDLAQRTEEQAQAVRESADTLDKLSEIANSNSSLAEGVSVQTSDMQNNAVESENAMELMIGSIGDIKLSSSKILDVVSVVEEIAFQTNLLALNASVEAARAGEHGKGFAVVATEVRNLALRSATAVKQIDELAKESSKLVGQGADQAGRMNLILQEFKVSADNVQKAVSEIGQASVRQATVLGELNLTIHSIDEMTEKNAASVQQSASGSRRLEVLSSELQGNVSYFSF